VSETIFLIHYKSDVIIAVKKTAISCFMSPPGKSKVGGSKNFFARSAREIVPPTFTTVAPPLLSGGMYLECLNGTTPWLVQDAHAGSNSKMYIKKKTPTATPLHGLGGGVIGQLTV